MKILFVTPYFPPEVGAPQIRIYESASRLAKMGHEVIILTTFPNYPSGIVPKEWRGRFFWKGFDQELSVYRIWSYVVPNRGFLKRLLGQMSFALVAVCAALMLPKCDAMIIESPPLFNGMVGLLAGRPRGIPYLFTVADLWPEAAIQMGVLKNRFLIGLAEGMEMLFYRRSAAVLAITSGIREKIVARGIRPSKVQLLRNAVDLQFFRPGLDAVEVRQVISGNGDFIVLYAGTLGMTQNLDVLLDAAALFQNEANTQVKFVLAGDGSERDRLKAKTRELNLSNVEFFVPFPKARMPLVLNAADCVVVSVSDLEVFRAALPTKLFEAMACAKPVVLAVKGEAADILAEAQAGVCVAPGDCVGIHDAIVRLMQTPELASKMGRYGRQYVVRHFDRDRRVEELVNLLAVLISQRSGTVPAVVATAELPNSKKLG